MSVNETSRRERRFGWLFAALVACMALAGLGPDLARAFVPAPDRLADAVADTNKAAGRDEAIKLELSMGVGDRVDIGQGELVSHPTGLARLELRGAGGLVERHLLRGTERLATRNGERLDDARFFLPPVFLLQAQSGGALRAALESFGIGVDVVGLAPCGDIDCYVLGDTARAVPRPPYPPIRGLDDDDSTGMADEEDLAARIRFTDGGTLLDEREAEDRTQLAGTDLATSFPVSTATLWIDLESYDIRRLGSRSGVRVTFGPEAVFDDLRVPSWIRIEEPDKMPVKFDVIRATKVSAPASSFGEDWLDAQPLP